MSSQTESASVATGIHTSPTASERASLAADRTRIADLGAHIAELECSLRSLQQERDILQLRLDTYTYPVLTLPNEIVSEIFVHFLPVYPKRPPIIGLLSPATLGQICRKWREIAFSTPALWRGITVHLLKKRRLGQKLRLLETFVQRSGACLLSVNLDSDIVEDGVQAVASFVQLVTSHCDRLEHLKLFSPQRSLPSIACSFPLLRSVHFGFSQGPGDWDDDSLLTAAFRTAPLLRMVTFGLYRDVFGTLFPWSQITVLVVHVIALHQYASVLNQAVNLVHCSLGFFPSLTTPEPQSLSAIAHPCLETLIFTGLSNAAGILDTSTLPALRRLQAKETILGPDPVGTLVSFVSRSRCHLQELSISTLRRPSNWYLTALPSVDVFMFDRNLDGFTFLEESDSEYDDESYESMSAEDSDADEDSDTDEE
ncbi:hypothetical protein FB451DRAFT_1129314 [Mycena latifolia]|nr:hypothetical protein FB451DRAFT_1129314 [Mycena latifolia]